MLEEALAVEVIARCSLTFNRLAKVHPTKIRCPLIGALSSSTFRVVRAPIDASHHLSLHTSSLISERVLQRTP
jgi:hypothetical protein